MAGRRAGQGSFTAMKRWLAASEWVVRLALGAVFLLAGALKVGAPQDFADAVYAYRILPAPLINPLALGLPIFELVLGAALLVGWRRRAMALAAALLFLIFTLALLQAKVRGLEIECACFGPAVVASQFVTPLPRDAVLLLSAIFLYWRAEVRTSGPAEVKVGA